MRKFLALLLFTALTMVKVFSFEGREVLKLDKNNQEIKKLLSEIESARQKAPGWCTQEKTEAIASLIYNIKPQLCVEVGVFGGSSFFPVALTLKHLKHGKAIAIDAWDNELCIKYMSKDDANRAWWEKVDLIEILSKFKQMLIELDLFSYYEICRKPSFEAAKTLNKNSIHFLHLNGNKSAKGSQEDIQNYLPLVAKDGYILLSDVNWSVRNQRPIHDAALVLSETYQLIALLEDGNAFLFKKAAPSKTIPITKYLLEYKANKKSCLESIDRVYVINLDKHSKKWQRMKKHLQDRLIIPNRVSGVKGWELSDSVVDELLGYYSRKIGKGHLGCLLSHVSVLQHALKNRLGPIWVMEDDIEIKGDVQEIPKLIDQLNKIDPDWDILYTDVDSVNQKGEKSIATGSDFRPDKKYPPLEFYLKRKNINNDLMRLGQRYGTYSMIISKKGIKKIYNYFTQNYVWSHIDIELHIIPGIREYSTRYDLVTVHCDGSPSDTFTTKER